MKVVLLAFGGLFSGFLSFLAAKAGDFMFSPGIIFGITISLYFLTILERSKLLRLFIFTLLSGISYHLAFRSFGWSETISENISRDADLILSLLIAGGVGASILAVSISFLIHRLSLLQYILVIFFGSLLSFSWFVIPEGSLFKTTGWEVQWEPFLSVYLFWQMGMAVVIGWATKKNS